MLSQASLRKWNLAQIDFRNAILQTGKAERNVYVVSPPESSWRRNNYWLLLTTAYSLVNANAKWQAYSNAVLYRLGFCQVIYVPQLFYLKSKREAGVIAVKIADDVLLAGINSILKSIVSNVEESYTLSTVIFSHGTFLFLGFQITQDENFETSIHADQKLEALKPIDTTRQRRKEIKSHLH